MKYKVTIETMEYLSNDKYPTKEEIYTQIVEKLGIYEVIEAVNDYEEPNITSTTNT